MFNLQAAHRELVLCILPLFLSLRSLKRSIVGKPAQFHGFIQIQQSNIHRKALAVRVTPLTLPGSPLKAKSVAFVMENRPQSLVMLCITTYGTDTLSFPIQYKRKEPSELFSEFFANALLCPKVEIFFVTTGFPIGMSILTLLYHL